jgi:surface carbohydrate biosynthesis protein
MNGSRNRAIAEAAHRVGTKVVVLQTEGRPNNVEIMDYAVGRDVDSTTVDLWFTWSDTVRKFLLERSSIPAERVVAAGPPRFDIYREPLHALVRPREELLRKYGLDPARPTITVATNFTCTKYHQTNRNFLRADWKDLGLSVQPSFSEPDAFAAADFEARERTLSVIRGVLANRQSVQVLMKPHPTEEHERYREFVRGCEREFGRRIAFIGLEYIWDVLNAADIHVHRMCTTGVEAWFLNVPSVDLHVMDYHAWSLKLPGAATEAVAGHDLVHDLNGLLTLIDYYLAGGQPSPEQLQARATYIEKWLLAVDGRRTEAHANALASLLQGATRKSDGSLADRVKVTARSAMRKMGLRTWEAEAVDRLGQVDCRISDDDAAIWLNRIRNILEPLAPEPEAQEAGRIRKARLSVAEPQEIQ